MEEYKNTPERRDVTRKYADILALSRPDSAESRRRHPRMSLENRAKIFSPFAALRGYDEELDAEKQRSQRVPQRFLSEEEKEQLSQKLLLLTKGTQVRVRYFAADTAQPAHPPVGFYHTITGTVQRIDPVYRLLHLEDRSIPFETLDQIQLL